MFLNLLWNISITVSHLLAAQGHCCRDGFSSLFLSHQFVLLCWTIFISIKKVVFCIFKPNKQAKTLLTMIILQLYIPFLSFVPWQNSLKSNLYPLNQISSNTSSLESTYHSMKSIPVKASSALCIIKCIAPFLVLSFLELLGDLLSSTTSSFQHFLHLSISPPSPSSGISQMSWIFYLPYAI